MRDCERVRKQSLERHVGHHFEQDRRIVLSDNYLFNIE
jgi:hypothetical protein